MSNLTKDKVVIPALHLALLLLNIVQCTLMLAVYPLFFLLGLMLSHKDFYNFMTWLSRLIPATDQNKKS